jgi:steroid 5-alpha reductase family enzyme
MIDAWWALLLVGWGAMALVMLGLWAYATRRGDASVVDAGWGYGIAILGILYAVLADGAPAQRALIGVLAGLTGLKIGTYVLVFRVIGKEEDGRYRTLRARWGDSATRRFFVFFQAQGALDVVLSVPFVAAALNPSNTIGALELAGAALWLVATAGETVADRQLSRFRADPANRGKVCDVGLWRTSRHPNYFFQILTWVAFALVATAAPWGWVGWLSPLLITYSILFVTGIPPTEAQALRSRGDAYRRYQRTTSPLVPWFPRRSAAA